jgi:DMSO/TMAO reductase YedYZ molybdopterin-dependent catalytic subunit
MDLPTPPASRGLFGRRRISADPASVPSGQYVTPDFPVLSAGPTPDTPLEEWTFTIDGKVNEPVSWTWEAFLALPSETVKADSHSVTKWSMLESTWCGVSLDTLLDDIVTAAEYLSVWSDAGYTTNLTIEDVVAGQSWVVYKYDGDPLEAEHGGPDSLLLLYLYFWKSAKWVRGLTVTAGNDPGFWKTYGYHDHGDPWLEQRYQGD